MARRAAAIRKQRRDLAPRKRPRQPRAHATFDAIVDACARLLPARGYAGVTTNHVAAAAGVGIASLYEYFPGKDAIVAEVAARLVARVLERLAAGAAAVQAAPAHDSVRRWIDLIYDLIDGERRLVAVFAYQVPFTSDLAATRAIGPALLALSRAMQRRAGPRVRLAAGAADLHLMINLTTSTILQLVLDPPADVPRDAMLAALAARIDRWIAGA